MNLRVSINSQRTEPGSALDRGGGQDSSDEHARLRGKRRAPRLNRRRSPQLIAFLVAGTAVAAVIAYGVTTHTSSPDGSRLTLHVPPAASQSAAVVQALPPPNLLKPLSPEEATKENSERPFAGRRDTPASRFILRTDADDRARALDCLAQAVYYEAGGEGVDGGRAVAQVVLNRLRHPGFPSTVCGVVYEGADRPTGCQFSFTCDGSMQRIPIGSLWARSKKIADEALKGHVFAPVGHATHYHADYVLPYWADSLDKSVQVGRHIFYRLRNVFGEARAFSQHYAGTEPPVREPGKTLLIPQTPEGQQLEDKLIGTDAEDGAKKLAPAPAKPATPLLIDATPSTLLADKDAAPVATHHSLQPSDCSAAGDGRQLKPLKATDLRAGSGQSTC